MRFAGNDGRKRGKPLFGRARTSSHRPFGPAAVLVSVCLISGVILWPALSTGVATDQSTAIRSDGISNIRAGAAPGPTIDQPSNGDPIGVDGDGDNLIAGDLTSDHTTGDRAGIMLQIAAGTRSRPTTTPSEPAITGAPTASTGSSTSATAAPATAPQSTSPTSNTDAPSTTASPSTTKPPSTTASPSTTNAPSTTGIPTGTNCFRKTFRDDFGGDSLSSDWYVYTSNGTHSPHAVRRAEAVTVENGLLTITAKNDDGGMLVSGGLRHNGSQTYGRYVFRVRTDADMTNATSGVVLTWPTSNNQARDGENNLYETLKAPGSRQPFYSFIHEPNDDRADGVSQKRFVHNADATQWQEITAEWTPGHLSVTRRGPGSVGSETQRLDEDAEDRITDATHFLSVQLDLFKGSFPDDREVKMEVDWVEIWSYCG